MNPNVNDGSAVKYDNTFGFIPHFKTDDLLLHFGALTMQLTITVIHIDNLLRLISYQ